MDRLTYFCEKCGNYYAEIENDSKKEIRIKKGQDYEVCGGIVDKLATFENLMDEYKIDNFCELEHILKLDFLEKQQRYIEILEFNISMAEDNCCHSEVVRLKKLLKEFKANGKL